MKSIYEKIVIFIKNHRNWSIFIAIIIIIAIWQGIKLLNTTTGEIKYVTATAEKGTIISSITASGQVETSNQIDLKARNSGEITYVGVKPGDIVKKGKTLFALNARTAQKAVESAKINLESAQIDLEKFQQAPDSVDVLTIKKSTEDAEQSKLDAAQEVTDSYRNLLNSSIVAVSSDTSNTQTAPTISGTYIKDKEAIITISMYQNSNGGYFSASSIPVGVVTGSGTITSSVPQAIGDSGLYIKFGSITSQPTWIITLPNKTASTYGSNMIAYQNALSNQKKVNSTADLTIAQNNKKLQDLYQPNSLDLRVKQLSVRQAENNLANAQADLSDYYIRAPFDGTIASVTGKLGDTATGTLGSIITEQKIATLSMNEVDVSKIKLGAKSTITFDAIDGLSITGTVAQIDTLGTVTQGVVSYNVKVAFDTDDDRIKPGMSVSASIITDSKIDVLTVPTSAIKTVGNQSYVQMFNPALPPQTDLQGTPSATPPSQVSVEIGISDDVNTEIVSGINEGDQVVSKTISTTATVSKPTTPSLLGGGNTKGANLGGSFRGN